MKRGFIGGWQNRRQVGVKDGGYWAGQENPNIENNPPLNDIFWIKQAEGYTTYQIGDDTTRVKTEVTFLSSVLINLGQNYRFYQHHYRPRNATTVTVSFGVVNCDEVGNLSEVFNTGRDVNWFGIGTGSNTYTAYECYKTSWSLSDDVELWDRIQNSRSFIRMSTMQMITTSLANQIYSQAILNNGNTISYRSLTIIGGTHWTDTALYWDTNNNIRVTEIIARARSLSQVKYWYGGSGQVANINLANSLRSSYPSIWTQKYYNEAIQDIAGGYRVGDCSYLVCYAYDIGRTSSTYLEQKYPAYQGTGLPGMILWRPGHVAITDGTYSIQLQGLKTDYVERPLSEDKYSKVLYDPNINYI